MAQKWKKLQIAEFLSDRSGLAKIDYFLMRKKQDYITVSLPKKVWGSYMWFSHTTSTHESYLHNIDSWKLFAWVSSSQDQNQATHSKCNDDVRLSVAILTTRKF